MKKIYKFIGLSSLWLILYTANASGLNVYSNKQIIGKLVNWNLNYLLIRSTKNYFVSVHPDGSLRHVPDGQFRVHSGGVFYSGMDCEGDAYQAISHEEMYPSANPSYGHIVYDAVNEKTFYASPKAKVAPVSFESFSSFISGVGACHNEEFGSLSISIRLLENKEEITGVPDKRYSSVIEINE